MCAHRHTRSPCGPPDASSRQTKNALWSELRELFASLRDPAIWLRACSLAVLRDRGDAAAFGIEVLPPGLLEYITGSDPDRVTGPPEESTSGQPEPRIN